MLEKSADYFWNFNTAVKREVKERVDGKSDIKNYKLKSTSEPVKLTVNNGIKLQIKSERVVAPSSWSCALNFLTFQHRGMKTKLFWQWQNKWK